MSRDEIIKIENLKFRYRDDGEWALKGVSFSIFRGEWLAIVGHNGSGKSTLAKVLNGLLLPHSGTVHVENIPLTKDTVWDIRKRVGMVFQNPDNQFVGTTVRDDVAFGLENIGVPREEMIKRIDESIAKVRMSEFTNYEPHRLSGGQKQRVAIAGVLALRPAVMILDEATSMLDPMGRKEVIETIRALQKESSNMSVVSITHDLEEVTQADRVIVMNRGELFAEGTPEEIFDLGEQLISLGLDLPFTVKLSRLLRQKGIQISKCHLKQQELVNELWTLYSKM
ncbi:energy-coupling factor ABC transporter ATP-binding protein [Calidifontibacillus erzurumensis]|uniref:Energy-coupling factor ABC transporter ATP-binding protein n=1 Tax=Calidifontibacillus erzurumensis TaxID=2741433 RepID=A0A8J8GF89_9BACI|nr:energy-coupling factor ABC transporter ATP-binding protein [Calidifontibacillus erzurumensis]NSL52562.1 energy-coupling factor ABC transporter ATP-binding protein [Calidifontibacillus erzurumensis]